MLCTAAAVSAIRLPAGPATYQQGLITLADGTTFAVQGDAAGRHFVRDVRSGDTIEICFGPARRWADAPATAREGFAVDVRTSDTYVTIGEPGRGATAFPPRNGAKRRPL